VVCDSDLICYKIAIFAKYFFRHFRCKKNCL